MPLGGIFVVVEDVPLVEFVVLVFTCMPGENYHGQFWSPLLCPQLCVCVCVVRACMHACV